jgi:heme/copper-type cytochrome/quinol oxidase subunit 4
MPSITADGLKLFACITMLIQTVGIAIIEKGMIHLDQYTQTGLSEALAEDSHLMMLAGMGSVMQLVGGLAIPVFAFLLVEGFRHTSNYRNYLLSVVLFALLSEIPYDMAMSQRLADWSSQNALVSMSISLMMLYFLDMMKEKSGWMYQAARLLLVVCAVLWVTLLRAQYGFCIVLLAAVFYLFYSKPIWKTILGILISLLYVTGPLSFYGIWCYNEKRSDRLPKYVYYIFYPLHLLVLGVISMMLS